MGKIFEALEKAEKKESTGRGDYTAVDVEKSDSPKTEAPGNQKPVVLSNNKQLPAEAVPKETQTEFSIPEEKTDQAKINRGNSVAPDPVDTQSSMTSDLIPRESRGAEKSAETNTSALDGKTPSAKLVPHQTQHKSEKEDSRNSGASSGRPRAIVQQEVTGQPAKKELTFDGDIGQARQKKRVDVRYSKTKVQFNDPEKLKSNRVLSIFDDVDTANQFKILRTQVLRKLKAIGGNSILVTSANPYEGKTFTSINLGLSIAKEFDRTVLIIDADIRRPTKHHTDFSTEFFSLTVEKGLTDYLAGDAAIEDILINPGIDKITLIPGGVPVDNSPELLNSGRMEKMMDEIKNRYPSDRLVIVDGPALLHFPDAMILYRYVDGVLPVVESERTSTEEVKKVMKQLQDVNLLGVVLNKNKG